MLHSNRQHWRNSGIKELFHMTPCALPDILLMERPQTIPSQGLSRTTTALAAFFVKAS